MKFFRARWLTTTFSFLLLALLCAEPCAVVAQRADGKDEGQFTIRAPHFSEVFSASLRLLQIKYGIDGVLVSVVPVFRGIISDRYDESTFIDLFSTSHPTNRDRGPPLLGTIG